MKKRVFLVLSIVFITVFVTASFAGCLSNKPFSSVAKTVDISADASIAIGKEDMTELLSNPDRGLRMETYITLGDPLDSYPYKGEDPFERAQQTIEKYKEDSPTLIQAYVYLSNYSKKPLDELALAQLKRYFEIFRDNGIRMLLRFTYSTENVEDATYAVMKDHLTTLKRFFNDNKELIDDTLYTMQLGMIGYWGEGHSSVNFEYAEHSKDLIKDMCEFIGKDMYLEVRTMELYQKVPLKYRDRVGIHDDYIIDDLNDEWAFLPKKDIRYRSLMKRFRKTVNDGEMPWGAGDSFVEGRNAMDGKIILERIYDNSLTSFSLEHNYRENEGAEYSMYKWKSQYLAYDECVALGISVNPRLFEVSGGKMSIYDVIRYHLGYQLELANRKMERGVLSFDIINYGFAAPLKMNYLCLVTEEDGELKEHKISAYDKERLQSNTAIRYSVRIPDGVKVVGVKLATDEKSSFTVRFSNGTDNVNGVQYFD